MGSSWRGTLPLQHASAVFVAELLGSEAGAATEGAAEEGEVGEVVLVADLLHRLRGVLDGGLELQDDEVVDDLLGSAAVVHAAYAAEVLGGDVEPLGIGVDGVEFLAVVVDKEHELVEDAERGGAGHLGTVLGAEVGGALVAHAQHETTEHAYALLVLAHGVLVAQEHVEEVVDGVEGGGDVFAFLEEELVHRAGVLDEGEYLGGGIAQQFHAGDADELGFPIGRHIGDVHHAAGYDDHDLVGLHVVGVDIDSEAGGASDTEGYTEEIGPVGGVDQCLGGDVV